MKESLDTLSRLRPLRFISNVGLINAVWNNLGGIHIMVVGD